MIRPSPAVQVRADATISECIALMNERQVDSLLVTSASVPHDLIGIFTERDVVRCAPEIQARGAWNKSVALVMTRSPQTISLYELGQAVEVMAQHRFRHLPVTYEDEGGKRHVAGMISMRDLFRAFAQGRIGGSTPSGVSPLRIGYLAADVTRQKSLSLILNQAKVLVGVAEYSSQALVPPAVGGIEQLHSVIAGAGLTHLVVDIDGLAPTQWLELIHYLGREGSPRGLVLFDRSLHSAKDVELIEGQGRVGPIRFFAKPLDVIALLAQIGASEK